MELVYVFRRGTDAAEAFRRKLYNAWLMDMRDRGVHYDIVILYASADGPIPLSPLNDGRGREDLTLEEGDVFLILSSSEQIEGVLEQAADGSGGRPEGPFSVPAGNFSVSSTVTFRR